MTITRSVRTLLVLSALVAVCCGSSAGAQVPQGTQVVVGATGPASSYGLARPPEWNGDLVIYAHGIIDVKAALSLPTEDPALEAMINAWLASGFGVAYSSYDMNGYALKDGAQRTHQLKGLFTSKFGAPRHTFLVGHSLGALVVLTLAERYPDQYAAVLPACGVVGGTRLEIDYVAHTRVVMDLLFPRVADRVGTVFDVKPGVDAAIGGGDMQFVLGELAAGFNPLATPFPAPTVLLGAAAALPGSQDHPQPGASFNGPILAGTALAVVNFGVRFTDNILKFTNGKIPFDNASTVYSAGFGPAIDAAINAGVARFTEDPSAANYLAHYYSPTGNARIPTLTLHNYYDPAVPFIHELEYGRRVTDAGAGDLVSQWVVANPQNAFGHCNFTSEQMSEAFGALVRWVYTGQKAAARIF